MHVAEQQKIEAAMHRSRLWRYGTGIAATVVAMWIYTLLYPTPEGGKLKTEAPSGKSPALLDMLPDVAGGKASIEIVDKVATGADAVPWFPKSIVLPKHEESTSAALPAGIGDNKEEYHLIGLGIRTVSFLSIKVYVVGMYVAASDLAKLQAAFVKQAAEVEGASTLVPTEQGKLQEMLLDAEHSERVWNEFLQTDKVRSVMRIVPTRDTDFAHLRDGWVRAVEGRANNSDKYVDPSDEKFGDSVRLFKAMFSGAGKPKVKKGRAILLERDANGILRAWVQNDTASDGFDRLGEIGDERIGRLIWLGYLGGKNVASQAARTNIISGIIEAVGRPVGTFETQVV